MTLPRSYAFITTYQGLSNTLVNEVHVSSDNPVATPSASFTAYKALWDTGAAATAISHAIVQQGNLQPSGMVTLHTANGECDCYTYLVSLVLPNQVLIPDLRVADCGTLLGADVLIGMDVIGKGDFAVSNHGGKTAFTFRIPSKETISFVPEKYLGPTPMPAQAMKYPGTPKNALCPCGSGKKYKQCCANTPVDSEG